jgi:hypothetical protein
VSPVFAGSASPVEHVRRGSSEHGLPTEPVLMGVMGRGSSLRLGPVGGGDELGRRPPPEVRVRAAQGATSAQAALDRVTDHAHRGPSGGWHVL